MRSTFSSGILFVPLLCGAVMIGCNQSTSTGTSDNAAPQSGQAVASNAGSLKSVNAECPVMGGEVTSDGGTAEWNGKLIGFCCPECVPKWEKLSDEEKAKKLVIAKSDSGSPSAPADH